MAVAGPAFPSAAATAAEDPWLDNDWTTPGNIVTDDGTTANVTGASYDSPDQTFVLKATGFDFSAIPDGSTINGVTVRVNAWFASGQGSGSLDLCQLLNTSAAKVGTNQCATPVALTTTTSTVITKGSASDLWGNALTTAWVKNANFGVALGILATAANADVFIDYVTIEIDYTPVSVTGTLSLTEAADSVVISGTVVTPVTGTLALTEASDSVVASGGETFTGTLALTNASDAVVMTGTETFTGTLSFTAASDQVSMDGTVTDPLTPVTGTLTATNANDSVVITGTSVDPVYTFEPPTYEEPIRSQTAPLNHFRLTYATSVLRVNGVLTSVRTPSPERIAAAGEEGVDYFRGGGVYEVSLETALELQAAGYSVGGL